MTARQLVTPVGTGNDERLARRHRREHRQEFDGRRVGPVQVVEQDQRRSIGGDGRERGADGLDQRGAVACVGGGPVFGEERREVRLEPSQPLDDALVARERQRAARRRSGRTVPSRPRYTLPRRTARPASTAPRRRAATCQRLPRRPAGPAHRGLQPPPARGRRAPQAVTSGRRAGRWPQAECTTARREGCSRRAALLRSRSPGRARRAGTAIPVLRAPGRSPRARPVSSPG